MFRLPVTLGAPLMVVVGAAIARELGGRYRTQVLAACAVAVSGVVIASHWLATYTLDPLWWTLIVWLVVRWTRVRDDRLLLAAGVVTGLSLNTKFLVPALWVGLVVGVALCGPRELLRRPMLWVGGLVAVAMTVPTLAWQAVDGWPYTQMADVVRSESDGPVGFAVGAAILCGLVGLPLVLVALVRVLRAPRRNPAGFLVVAVIIVVIAMVALGGRAYYMLAVLPAMLAVGAVEWSAWRQARRTRTALGVVGFGVATALLLVSVPVLPQPVIDAVPALPANALQAGERAMAPAAAAGAAAYTQVPPGERDHTVVVAQIYPLAAAIDNAGGVPVYSPHRGYGYFAPPPATATDALWIGFDGPDALRPYFASCTQQPADGLQVWRCTGRLGEWTDFWAALRSR